MLEMLVASPFDKNAKLLVFCVYLFGKLNFKAKTAITSDFE